ncbi:MAG TPA: DUF1858 domain-containing protein [Clostridiales bacterium]|jgi:hybrid cluster-associated redox disulfide protein|nr:DUF1858 domain-containing protein [Clostridiales bacterium]
MITKNMLISEILNYNETMGEILERNGLSCVNCPGADNETLEEAAEGHGVDLEELLQKLNASRVKTSIDDEL